MEAVLSLKIAKKSMILADFTLYRAKLTIFVKSGRMEAHTF